MELLQVPAVTTVEPPKPEVAEIGLTTHPPLYDTVLYVRCFCPTGVEGRELKCSITHGAQFEKTSRLDFTDEEVRNTIYPCCKDGKGIDPTNHF